jgi:hypothetical protein
MNSKQKLLTTIALIPMAAAALTGCGPQGRDIPKHGPNDVYHSQQVMCGPYTKIGIAQEVFNDRSIYRYDIPSYFQRFIDEGYLCNLSWYTNPDGKATEAHMYLADGTGAGIRANATDLMEYAVGATADTVIGATTPIPQPTAQALENVVQPTSTPGLSDCSYTVQEGDTLYDLFYNSQLSPYLKDAYQGAFEEFVKDLSIENPDQLSIGQKLWFMVRMPDSDISNLCR